MDKSIKLQALLATVKAYKDRGVWLQYDELSMDRVAVVSSRRQSFAPPEAATAQNYLFLDCSSFIWACFYQAFDYMLEADLTWYMFDYLTPEIYRYEITHDETPEEIRNRIQEIREILQPGDVITYQQSNGIGHTMLYMDEHTYANCSKHGTFNGYSYKECKNVFTGCGGVYFEPVDDLFRNSGDPVTGRNYLFKDGMKRFAVHRPLDAVGEPVSDAVARIGEAAGLVCSVETDYPGGRTAEPGSRTVYRVVVRNTNPEAVRVRISFKPGWGSSISSQEYAELAVDAGSEETAVFAADICTGAAFVYAPEITVNGLHIAAPRILTGRNLDRGQEEQLCLGVDRYLAESPDTACAVSSAYRDLGITVSPDARELLRRLFFLHDGSSGDVLSRRPREPEKDMCVTTLFGGKGVVTPESCTSPDVRCTYISRNDLQTGDIILLCDDANLAGANMYFWNGETVLGTDESPDAFIDSLFGRFCFAVLRPGLGTAPQS